MPAACVCRATVAAGCGRDRVTICSYNAGSSALRGRAGAPSAVPFCLPGGRRPALLPATGAKMSHAPGQGRAQTCQDSRIDLAM